MITELLLLGAVGAGTAYAVDPQFRDTVNTAIAGITGAPSTSTQQSVSTNASNTGAGWQEVMNALSQLFQNQELLQKSIGSNSGSGGVVQPPPITINYPQNPPTQTGTSQNPSTQTGTPQDIATNALNAVLSNPQEFASAPLATQLAVQSAVNSAYNPNTGQLMSVGQIAPQDNPLINSAAASRNQALINSNNAQNTAESGNPAYANIIAARNAVNAERAAGLLAS